VQVLGKKEPGGTLVGYEGYFARIIGGRRGGWYNLRFFPGLLQAISQVVAEPAPPILYRRWDYIRRNNRFIILPITKNNTSPVVPINDPIHRILSEMPEKTGSVFGNGNGGHIGDIKHSFPSACRKAGITDFRLHDLRHTYASHLAMRGVHIRALQELLGHKTLAMTQRYSHLAPEQLQNAVKLLDGAIGEKKELGGQVAT
jgi:hypothetical protein